MVKLDLGLLRGRDWLLGVLLPGDLWTGMLQGALGFRVVDEPGKRRQQMRKIGISLLLLLMVVGVSGCEQEQRSPADGAKTTKGEEVVQTALKESGAGEQDTQEPVATPEKPKIEFDHEKFEFGQVEAGEEVEHIYPFRNVGDATLKINKVRSG
jgi:hypothetical protein